MTQRVVRRRDAARRQDGIYNTPHEPEYRPSSVTPTPLASPDDLARELAADPEFEQWAFEIRHTLPRSVG